MNGNNLGEIKMEESVDNTKLNNLMSIHPEDMSYCQREEFLEELKQVRLIMPMEITSGIDFENLKEVKVGDSIKFDEGLRFKPFRLKDNQDNVVLPLFTDNNELKNSNIVTHVMVMYSSDIANMLKDLTDEFDSIALNFTNEYSITMPVMSFINLFNEKEENSILEDVLYDLKEHYIELPENLALYCRTDKPYFYDEIEDYVYTNKMPLNLHFSSSFNAEDEVLNEFLIPEGTKILFLGEAIDPKTNYPFILAPFNHFQFIEKESEYKYVWEWIGEDFY